GRWRAAWWRRAGGGLPGRPAGPAGVLSSAAWDGKGLAVGAWLAVGALGAVPEAQPAMTAQPSAARRISGRPRAWLMVPALTSQGQDWHRFPYGAPLIGRSARWQ